MSNKRSLVHAFPTIKKIPLLRTLHAQCHPGESLMVDARPTVYKLPPTEYGTPRQREVFTVYAQHIPVNETVPRTLCTISRVRHLGERERVTVYAFNGTLIFH